MRINVRKVSGRKPLFKQYPNQYRPQKAYIYIDPRPNDGPKVWADWDGEIGGATHMVIYNRFILRVPVDCEATCKKINNLFKCPEFLGQIQTVVENWYTDVDCNGNLRGKLTDDGYIALDRLEILAE